MKIWADIDNAPHVLVLYPIIKRLQSLGHEVCVTARDYGQVIPLLKLYGLEFRLIGKHAGSYKIKKVLFFLLRSYRLLLFALGRRFDLVFCHGTRGVFIPARLLNIPLVVISDYEYGYLPLFMSDWPAMKIVPEVIQDSIIRERGFDPKKYRKYPGLKEELYVYDRPSNTDVLNEMGVPHSKVVVLIRPPATMAHYHVIASEQLFYGVMDYLIRKEEIHIVLLPRTDNQKKDLEAYLKLKSANNVTVPNKAYRGPELIRSADIVISGGGTMNREAACLGVPVYSIYAGPLGAVDRHLIETGKLKQMVNAEQINEIVFQKKSETIPATRSEKTEKLINFIVQELIDTYQSLQVQQ